MHGRCPDWALSRTGYEPMQWELLPSKELEIRMSHQDCVIYDRYDRGARRTGCPGSCVLRACEAEAMGVPPFKTRAEIDRKEREAEAKVVEATLAFLDSERSGKNNAEMDARFHEAVDKLLAESVVHF